jgi:hypothetical protein
MQLRRDFAERRRRVRAGCEVIEQHDEVLPDST